MRHRRRSLKLSRTSAHRQAMVRNLVTALFAHERIETTHAKARLLRPVAERMITLGKRGDLHARRRALRVIRDRDVATKVFTDLAERYRERNGGYTRVLRLRTRVGDAAPMSLVELVEGASAPKSEKKSEKKAEKKKARRTAEAEPKKKATRKPAASKPAARSATRRAAPAEPSGPKGGRRGRQTSRRKQAD
jgi:large subunit ribosomal protein L17